MQCPLCTDFSVPTFQLLLHHISRVHANSPDFNMPCGVETNGNRCETTFTNFHAYKRHLRKKHRWRLCDGTDSNTSGDLSEDEDENGFALDHDDTAAASDSAMYDRDVGNEDSVTSTEEEKNSFTKETAMWILKLKEGRKLTQSTTEEILSDVTELCTDVVCRLGHDILKVLESAGVNASDIPGLHHLLSETSPYSTPFSNLKSQFLQLSYYRNHLNFVVSG